MKGTIALALLAALALGARAAGTCSCASPASVMDGFESEVTPVYKARAVAALQVEDAEYSWTVFEWKVVFRGCAPSGPTFVVKSPLSVAGCGVAFAPGETYLITARMAGSSTPPPGAAGQDVYSAVSCNYNRIWADVPYEDQLALYYSEVRGCLSS